MYLLRHFELILPTTFLITRTQLHSPLSQYFYFLQKFGCICGLCLLYAKATIYGVPASHQPPRGSYTFANFILRGIRIVSMGMEVRCSLHVTFAF